MELPASVSPQPCPQHHFTWTVDANTAGGTGGSGVIGDIISQSLSNTTDNALSVIYHITPEGAAPTNCPGPTVDRTVQIEPTPKAAINNTTATICSGGNVNLNITSPTSPTAPTDLMFNLRVSSTNNAALGGSAKNDLNNQSFPLVINGDLTNSSDEKITVTFKAVPTLAGCANGDTVYSTVVVEPQPKGVLTNNALKICEGKNVDITISSPTVPSDPTNLKFDLSVSSSNNGATGGTAFAGITNGSFPLNLNGTLTNNSNDDITITYTLTPKLNGCANGPIKNHDCYC